MPLIPVLFSLIAQVAPGLISHLLGTKAGTVAGQVIDVAKVVTGTSTQEDAAAALAADPTKVTELSVKLAQIQADADKAVYADAASARQMQMTAVQSTSLTSWMPYVFGTAVLGTWIAAMLHLVPAITAADAANVTATLGPILGFIYGNNRNARTDAMLSNSVPAEMLRGVTSMLPLGPK